ncbi:hypothetical protein ES703_60168 [subsurface metagenome]
MTEVVTMDKAWVVVDIRVRVTDPAINVPAPEVIGVVRVPADEYTTFPNVNRHGGRNYSNPNLQHPAAKLADSISPGADPEVL